MQTFVVFTSFTNCVTTPPFTPSAFLSWTSRTVFVCNPWGPLPVILSNSAVFGFTWGFGWRCYTPAWGCLNNTQDIIFTVGRKPTPGCAHSLLLGSVLRDRPYWDLEDTVQCWGSNLDQPRTRQVSSLMSYLRSPLGKFSFRTQWTQMFNDCHHLMIALYEVPRTPPFHITFRDNLGTETCILFLVCYTFSLPNLEPDHPHGWPLTSTGRKCHSLVPFYNSNFLLNSVISMSKGRGWHQVTDPHWC